MSAFVMLEATTCQREHVRPFPRSPGRHALESVREGEHGKGGEKSVDVGSVRRADGVVSRIWWYG